ncbi:MAG: hypothetical protein JW384_04359 [Nitrosomonadaceae bacterium]|nr:hypothetical protein [Nitrosomonadaceae bacterium]
MKTGITLKTPTNTISEGLRFSGFSRTITDAHFLFFSAVSGDTGRGHMDAEYSKHTKLGRPSAHGLFLMSITALGASHLKDRPPGWVFVEQGCKFLKPTVEGDTLKPEFEVEKIWEEGHRTFCRLKVWVTNQRDETVLEGFHLYRIIPLKSALDKPGK